MTEITTEKLAEWKRLAENMNAGKMYSRRATIDFVFAAREAVPALVAEVERLRNDFIFWADKCYVCGKPFTAEEWCNRRSIREYDIHAGCYQEGCDDDQP